MYYSRIANFPLKLLCLPLKELVVTSARDGMGWIIQCLYLDSHILSCIACEPNCKHVCAQVAGGCTQGSISVSLGQCFYGRKFSCLFS